MANKKSEQETTSEYDKAEGALKQAARNWCALEENVNASVSGRHDAIASLRRAARHFATVCNDVGV